MCVPLMEHKFIYLITHKKHVKKKQVEFTQQQVCVHYDAPSCEIKYRKISLTKNSFCVKTSINWGVILKNLSKEHVFFNFRWKIAEKMNKNCG